MAAWSDHTHETIKQGLDSLTLGSNSCHRSGAPWRKSPSPEMPGCWDLFTDEALIELLADASSELGRRGKDILVGSSKRVTA